jgi:RNA recognition motif-containing protein
MTKLFVVGLPREMDEMQLEQLFGPFGDIKLLTIIRDKSNGESKGYAFIQMGDQGADDAIAGLNGYTIGGRQLEVRIADEKPEPAAKQVFKAKPVYVPVSPNTVKKKRPRISK